MEKTQENPTTIIPFSTGTGHAEWQDVNCDYCAKSYQPPIRNGYQQWPSDKTMRQYCRDGRECPMKYALDIAWIDGSMPIDMALKVGYKPDGEHPRWPARCVEWKDRGDGGNPRGPKKPRPVPANQLSMGFEFSEIAQNHIPIEKREKVTL